MCEEQNASCVTARRLRLLTTLHLTEYCAEQRATWRKAENVAVKQFPSVVLNINVIINVVTFVSARHIVSTEVIVDDTSLINKKHHGTALQHQREKD